MTLPLYESASRRVGESKTRAPGSSSLRLFVSPIPNERPYVFFLLLGLLVAGPVWAQQNGADRVQRNAQAEEAFERALEAFEAENYAIAYARFLEVYERFALHRKTTAAMLMAGKALYRNGEYRRAVEVLTALQRDYPTSSYRTDAGRTLGFAQQKLREEELRGAPIRLGIALPMNRADRALTQTLFTGIRMAVDEYNRNSLRPVKMIFRDTQNSPSGARSAIEALTGQAVDVVVGPLYSEEAQEAARTAEREGMVLLAPLATDDGVAQGRQSVFQANPTMGARGAAMARFALEDLQMRSIGVVAESGNAISERMAEGFHKEALRLGGNVVFYELLTSSGDWSQLPERIGSEALASVDGLYLPIHRDRDRDMHRLMEGALASLDQLPAPPRVLGGSQWHDVPFQGTASAFDVTYTDVFHVDDAQDEVRRFKQRYRELSEGQQPRRLAYVGYDVASFLIVHLTQRLDREQPLPDLLRTADVYQGLGTRIKFSDDHINEALFLLHYATAGITLLR